MRALPSAATALALVFLSGCSLYNNPTPAVLKRCVVIGKLPLGQPLSVLVKALTSTGGRAQWVRGRDRTYLLHVRRTDQLSGKTGNFALEIDQADDHMTGPNCGPGAASIIQGNLDGQNFETIIIQNLLVGIVQSYLRHQVGSNAPDSVTSAPAQPAATPPPMSSADDDLQAEAEADGAYYAEQAKKAAAKQIAVIEGGRSHCCLTVGQAITELRSRGATATIDTDDDGTVRINAESSTPIWQGHSELTLEFHPALNGDLVELFSVKAGELPIAGAGSNVSAARYLIDNFNLTKAAD